MKNFIYRLGKVEEYGREASIYVKAEIKTKGKTLDSVSFHGVVGPLQSGNAVGSCGQIDATIKEYLDAKAITYAPGWNKWRIAALLKLWDEHHLNYMEPACEHQRAQGWGKIASEKVTLYEFKQTIETIRQSNAVKDGAMKDLLARRFVKISEEEQKILSLEYRIKSPEAKLPDTIAAYYKLDGSEVKALGWLDQEEHPRGILSKPCPVCGYKYGTEWKKRDLPEDLLETLAGFPPTDQEPAWV